MKKHVDVKKSMNKAPCANREPRTKHIYKSLYQLNDQICKVGEKMSIYRVKKNTNYVVMSKTVLHDDRLSWKAKGLHAYMLSMPDDWVFYNEELVKHASDGISVVKNCIKELKQFGYLARKPVKDDMGRITSWETHVFEYPEVEKPPTGKSTDREIHPVENRQLLNNNSLLNNDPLPFNDISIPYFEIIKHLNEKTKSNYRHTSKKTKDLIKARWNDGFELADFITVINNKVADWANDPKWVNYLRPETLFGTKFESYLNQKGGVSTGPHNNASETENENQYDFGF